MTDDQTLAVTRIGSRGDGVVDVDGEMVYVPFALPGETWQRAADGSFRCLGETPDRAAPPCPHFTVCGGCVAQHMPATLYAAWKTDIVRQAFRHQGIDIAPPELRRVASRSRRRCVLTAAKSAGRLVLGYHEARSHALVDLADCPVLAPAISNALNGLRTIADALLGDKGELRLTVLASDTGLDIDVAGRHRPLVPELRERLAALAGALPIARLVVGGSEVVQFHRPRLTISDVEVPLPPAVFVQAVAAAEAWLTEAVVTAAGPARTVADLFCGVGTFTFALARRARVHAFDADRSSITALAAARDGASRLKPIDGRVRNLMREPLSRKELEPYDCVVFDPPRAGAEAQAAMLAKSRVPRVIAVSCNPTTLARDVRLLLAGGYTLEDIRLIDQFLFSAHVECVAVLQRPKTRR